MTSIAVPVGQPILLRWDNREAVVRNLGPAIALSAWRKFVAATGAATTDWHAPDEKCDAWMLTDPASGVLSSLTVPRGQAQACMDAVLPAAWICRVGDCHVVFRLSCALVRPGQSVPDGGHAYRPRHPGRPSAGSQGGGEASPGLWNIAPGCYCRAMKIVALFLEHLVQDPVNLAGDFRDDVQAAGREGRRWNYIRAPGLCIAQRSLLLAASRIGMLDIVLASLVRLGRAHVDKRLDSSCTIELPLAGLRQPGMVSHLGRALAMSAPISSGIRVAIAGEEVDRNFGLACEVAALLRRFGFAFEIARFDKVAAWVAASMMLRPDAIWLARYRLSHPGSKASVEAIFAPFCAYARKLGIAVMGAGHRPEGQAM